MDRRKFIDAAGTTALIAPIVFCFAPGIHAADSSHLVDTPEKRAEYLTKILKALCTDLGPHPMGSPEFNRAAQIVKKEMERSLPKVELDTFTVDYWKIEGEPELYIGNNRVEIYPRIETAGTPPGGINGVITSSDIQGIAYGIADRSSGEFKAYITPYGGKARPLYASKDEMKALPTVTIGKQDLPLLKNALNQKTPVRLNVRISVTPDTPTCNVVGTLPGETKDEIVFIAHLDTVYSAPGANDNTASVAAMLMLAHTASGRRHKKTLTFLATTGEERGGFRGATHYVEKRKRDGTLQNIKFIVNFDSGTWSPDVEIWSEDEELQGLIQAIDKELNINGTPVSVDRTGFTLDAKPFRETGARAIYVESKGQDKIYIWHRPLDTPANVQGLTVEINFQLFNEYIKRVQDM